MINDNFCRATWIMISKNSDLHSLEDLAFYWTKSWEGLKRKVCNDSLASHSFIKTISQKQNLNKRYTFSRNDCKDLLNEQLSKSLRTQVTGWWRHRIFYYWTLTSHIKGKLYKKGKKKGSSFCSLCYLVWIIYVILKKILGVLYYFIEY